jgi:predicted amidophosphoribosyltransferase
MECPVCNRRDVSERLCPRCGSDLAHLWEVDQAQRCLLAQGGKLLREENFSEALIRFRRAYALARTEQARKGIIVAGICAALPPADSRGQLGKRP